MINMSEDKIALKMWVNDEITKTEQLITSTKTKLLSFEKRKTRLEQIWGLLV